MFQQLPPASQNKIKRQDYLMPSLAVRGFAEPLVAGTADARKPQPKQFPLSFHARDGLESFSDVLEQARA